MVTTPSFYNLKDQGIYAAGDFFIPQERYRAAPYNASQPNNPDEVPAGIPTVYQPRGGGGGGGYTGGVNDLITDYNRITKDRYFRSQDTPLVDGLYQTKVGQTFLGMPSYRQQELTGPDLGEYIGTNTDVPLELTTAGKIQQGLGSFKDKVGSAIGTLAGFGPISTALSAIDRFGSLPSADRQFIEMNMGYTGPTVFGENTTGLGKDPYGINTRSIKGNYADYVESYDTDYTEEELEAMSKFKRQKIQFYQQKQKELKEIQEAEIEKQKQQARDFMAKNPNYGNNYQASKDHSGDGGYGHTASSPGATTGSAARSRHSRSSDLGFSDIRLKENVELIGKSPSNINIYSFNYLNNPTKYQGVMAHEVPWASQKHNSGYLMVDYNKVDVDFKKHIDYRRKRL